MKNKPDGTKNKGRLISKTARAGVWTLVMCMVATSAWADFQGEEDLILHVSGFTHDRGQAVANLFREGDDLFGKPFARVVADVRQGKATLAFARPQPGHYAVTVFHDENGNNTLDHNFLHLPAEPLGFSNGFKLSLFSGKPTFEKLRFAFGPGTKPLEISVK